MTVIGHVRQLQIALVFLAAIATSSCGGGGGGGGGSDPPDPPDDPPTVTLDASRTDVLAGENSTLTWSSTNATTCTASGDWSGSKTTSGSEEVGPLNASATFTLACSGGGSNASDSVSIAVTTSLSGALLVPSISQADSDSNDIILTPISNNTFQDAQALPNPALVGGYVNEPGDGPDGPVHAAGDLDDVYAVSLLEGQVIELTVANPEPAIDDLDLGLYDSTQTLVDASVGTSRVERLTVPASGDYFIQVANFQGASNYVLSIGQTGSTALASPTLSDAFVPGEVLVKLAAAGPRPSERFAAQRVQDDVIRAHRLARAGGDANRELLLRSTSETMPQLAMARPAISRTLDKVEFANSTDRKKLETLYLIKRLSTNPELAWVEPNYLFAAQAVPNDPLYSRQRWHYEQINLPAAWDITTGSSDVIVAVVDTGVRPHLELTAKFVAGFDFVSGANSGDGDGLDADASDPGVPQGASFSFHGTHVAGTIGAITNDGVGVAGVAWGAAIMPVRVLGADGFGSLADIVQGIRFAAGLANDSGTVPADAADIINLSLGGPGFCASSWQSVIDAARAAGTTIIASAGNANTDGDFQPAGCDGVISVSAVDASRTRAPYSNFGTGVDVAAPGGNLSADFDGDGYADGVYSTHSFFDGSTYFSSLEYLQGTSMAAPHVSGVVALMKSVNPGLTPADVDNLLSSGSITNDIGPPGPDELGVGLIDANMAVLAAGGPPPARPPQLSVAPSTINYGDLVAFNEVIVSNAGDGAVAMTGATASEAWISVVPTEVDANGLGAYRIDVVRDGLAAGVYNGWVEFTGDAGTPVRTTILMQVSSTVIIPDAGQHYILLVNPTTGETLYQTEIRARELLANFSFGGLEVGDYLLVAGTDLNNDGFICDDGEACGEYPVFGARETISLLAPRSNVDFATAFRANATQQTVLSTDKRIGFARLR